MSANALITTVASSSPAFVINKLSSVSTYSVSSTKNALPNKLFHAYPRLAVARESVPSGALPLLPSTVIALLEIIQKLLSLASKIPISTCLSTVVAGTMTSISILPSS